MRQTSRWVAALSFTGVLAAGCAARSAPRPAPRPGAAPRPTSQPSAHLEASAPLPSCTADDTKGCEPACDAGDPPSCAIFAKSVEEKWGPNDFDRRVPDAYAKACDGGVSWACGRLGLLAADAPPKYGAAWGKPRALIEKGCEGGDAASCMVLGNLVSRADHESYWMRACSLGALDGCLALAEAHERRSDWPDARVVLERACPSRGTEAEPAPSGDPSEAARVAAACFQLGRRLYAGTSMTKDVPGGVALIQRACEAKVERACVTEADIMAVGVDLPEDDARAVALLKGACDADDGSGCRELALCIEAGRAPGDHAELVRLHEKACHIGMKASCIAAGDMAKADKGAEAALPLYALACHQATTDPNPGHAEIVRRLGCSEAKHLLFDMPITAEHCKTLYGMEDVEGSGYEVEEAKLFNRCGELLNPS
jgi:TPR repeat protein